MNRSQLEHIIRAAADVTNQYEIVVVGSQSILGAFPNAPAECTLSIEADVFPLGAEELSDEIDGAIGEGSPFHEMYKCYAQGVDSTTSTLPANWEHRLVRIQNQNTNLRIGWCLDPVDLFLAKCHAWRDKDQEFTRALLREKFVSVDAVLERVPQMPEKDRVTHEVLRTRILRLANGLSRAGRC